MTNTNKQPSDDSTRNEDSILEQFLQSVEAKATNPIHHRLLKACRQAAPLSALEAELKAIATEIINET